MRLVLYQPEIPQNLGAAIRIAACFGVGVDVIEPCGFPLKAREVRRVAMDYGALAEPVAHASWSAFEQARRGRLILLTTKAEKSVWEFAFSEDDALILGRESAGAPDAVHAAVDARLAIPIAPAARSLNVHVAGAIALAEARRQLRAPAIEKSHGRRIGAVTLVVNDYDDAIAYFCGKLGFLLLEDSDLGDGKRWVRVAPRATGTALLLARAVCEDQSEAVGRQTGGRVGFFLETDDFERDYRKFRDSGVRFSRLPRDETYGRVAVFEDLYGNLWDLIAPRTKD